MDHWPSSLPLTTIHSLADILTVTHVVVERLALLSVYRFRVKFRVHFGKQS